MMSRLLTLLFALLAGGKVMPLSVRRSKMGHGKKDITMFIYAQSAKMAGVLMITRCLMNSTKDGKSGQSVRV